MMNSILDIQYLSEKGIQKIKAKFFQIEKSNSVMSLRRRVLEQEPTPSSPNNERILERSTSSNYKTPMKSNFNMPGSYCNLWRSKLTIIKNSKQPLNFW
jgi:hypothetical protein